MKFLPFLAALAAVVFASASWAEPASYNAGLTPAARLAPIEMPRVTIPGTRTTKPQPMQFAVPITTRIAPSSNGLWESLADGRQVWRALVVSHDASSLNLAFTRYRLPAGAQLYLYGMDGSDLRGPYTHADASAGQLWTPLVRGEAVVVEVDLPSTDRSALDLELTRVNHGYVDFWKGDTPGDKSGSCNVDVACAQGDGWRNEIRSVARYTIAGQFLCSGQLVNNTRLDFAPYFLTANHCLATAEDAAATVYYWNFQTSSCGGNADGRLDQNQSGASLVATYAPSDFTLLQLQRRPDAGFHVYYAGWDHSDGEPANVTTIHHPAGDEKRISYSGHPTHASSYGGSSGGDRTHLRIERWDVGTTEGGSSGAGLWNADHRLVGQLHGGNASCDAPSESDWFGRFAVSWAGGGNAGDSLKPNLDPISSAAKALDGADPQSSKLAPIISAPARGKFGGALPLVTLLGLALMGLRRRR